MSVRAPPFRPRILKLISSISLFLDSLGKPLSSSKLSRIFKQVIKEWRAFDDSVPSGKITFHVFRISSIGYHAIDLDLSIFEVQSISRHRFTSKVTEEIYLAKSKEQVIQKTASKVATKQRPSLLQQASAKVSSLVDPSTNQLLNSTSSNSLSWMSNLSVGVKQIFQAWQRF